ncbi:hypothetical protein FGO68_gene13451 [Halteria grandinella]|uniref:Uncharacterized protein n=1 Tax=Halteria grandinella TaxID=5974 RepID=A0A8J8SXG3_HALGN|nr:hypothetical protein FGO68_gene13451 [Halteria grandinella]
MRCLINNYFAKYIFEMNFREEEANEKKMMRLASQKAIDMKDPQVILQSVSEKADKFEYKRINVDDKELIRRKMRKLEEDATLLGPGRRPLRWFNGDKISEKLGLDMRRRIDLANKPHIVQHYEMQQDIEDNLTLKFTGKAGRSSAQAQMKDLVKKFDDAKRRITKLKLYGDLIKQGEAKQVAVTGGKDYKKIRRWQNRLTGEDSTQQLGGTLIPSTSYPSLLSGSPSKSMLKKDPSILMLEAAHNEGYNSHDGDQIGVIKEEHSEEQNLDSVLEKVNSQGELEEPFSPKTKKSNSPQRRKTLAKTATRLTFAGQPNVHVHVEEMGILSKSGSRPATRQSQVVPQNAGGLTVKNSHLKLPHRESFGAGVEFEYFDDDYDEDEGRFPPIPGGQNQSPQKRGRLSMLMKQKGSGSRSRRNVKAKVFSHLTSATKQEQRPPRPLKRPPVFPVPTKGSTLQPSEETEKYLKAPVFNRLQQKATTSYANYLTAQLTPLNARIRPDFGHSPSATSIHYKTGSQVLLSGSASASKMIVANKRDTSLDQLRVIQSRGKNVESDDEGAAQYNTEIIKKKLTNFDQSIQQDFTSLESRITRNIKRNQGEDDHQVRYHRIWFRPKKLIPADKDQRGEREALQPFVIGYFKEDVKYDVTPEERELYRAVLGSIKATPEDLFDKNFVMMEHPQIRPKAIIEALY